MQGFKKLLQRYLMVILAVIVLIVSILFSVSVRNGQKSDLAAQASEISQLENQIDVLKRSAHNIEQKAVQQAVGLDDSRISRDEELINEFMSSVMSWSSWDEYEGVRNRLKETYGLTDDSDVLTVFMPSVPNEVSNDGKTNYNRIDTYGIHMSYDSSSIYNTNIKGTDYSYAVFADWHTSDKNGSVGRSSTIFTLTINHEGVIRDLHAFA